MNKSKLPKSARARSESDPPRPPDPRIETDAAGLPALEIVGYLRETLGQHATVFLTVLPCVGQTGRDARPTTVTDHPIADLRLRPAYKISRTITEAFDDQTALAWFFGTNVDLDDEPPITILREADDPTEFEAVLAAVRSLVSFGG